MLMEDKQAMGLLQSLIESDAPQPGAAAWLFALPVAQKLSLPPRSIMPRIVRLNHDDPTLDRAAIRARIADCAEADGFELIFPRNLLGHRRLSLIRDLLGMVKREAADRPVTVVLETGTLKDAVAIHEAALLAVTAGATRIGTASGCLPQGSDVIAAELLLRIASDAEPPRGVKIGALPDLDAAKPYLTLAQRLFGPNWVNAQRMRLELVQR